MVSKLRWLLVFSFFFLLAVFSDQARAATWVGASGNWSNAANWDTGQVPPNGADVVIGGTGTYTVTLDVPATVNTLTLGGTTGGLQTLNLNSASLTLNGAGTVEPTGILQIAGGSLTGGTLNVNGKLQWNYGGMSNGTTNIADVFYLINHLFAGGPAPE